MAGLPYRGRFAPSPTGPLHAGSLVAALASYLDAKAHRGTWLVRIEDTDTPRCVPGVDRLILQQLTACGLQADEDVVWQSQRHALYQTALQQLRDAGLAYACSCTRKDIAAALAAQGQHKARHGELVYPGTCRLGVPDPHKALAWRFRLPASGVVTYNDRLMGLQTQDVSEAVGDFVLLRADGVWTYQLAVVVDDAAQGITHVVRGQDLADNTPRQILLQAALGLPQPSYLHTPLVCDAHGEKLSKQQGAASIDVHSPQAARSALNQAAQFLQLPPADAEGIPQALVAWTAHWATNWATQLTTQYAAK